MRFDQEIPFPTRTATVFALALLLGSTLALALYVDSLLDRASQEYAVAVPLTSASVSAGPSSREPAATQERCVELSVLLGLLAVQTVDPESKKSEWFHELYGDLKGIFFDLCKGGE